MARGAHGVPQARALKLKLTGELALDIERVRAVRAARPEVWIGVDANQGYRAAALGALLPALVDAPRGAARATLRRAAASPTSTASTTSSRSPPTKACRAWTKSRRCVGRFDVVNIKLDKCGGLTEGLLMAAAARRLGPRGDGRQHGRHQPRDGAGLRAGPALRHRRPRRRRCSSRGTARPACATSMATSIAPTRSGVRRATPHERAAARTAGGDWLGQPRGLTILFLTQMWEIFSFYGMRALLVYYMTKQLLLGQQQASLIYGIYTAMVYFTPIVGGVISDRWLGRRRAVIIGGSVMALGHFLMAFEPAVLLRAGGDRAGQRPVPAQPAEPDRRPVRRATIRAAARPTTSTTSASTSAGCSRRWSAARWASSTAGTGASARPASACWSGLAIYVLGGRHLPPETVRARAAPAATRRPPLRRTAATCAASCGCCSRSGCRVVVFRGAYEQIGNTIALWADSGVDRARSARLLDPDDLVPGAQSAAGDRA